MRIIGITGQFCSGKSAVAKILGRLYNARVIDADSIGHQVLSDKAVRERLIAAFGSGIIDKAGAINRKRLAAKAFTSSRSHGLLCRITHPLLAKRIISRINKIRADNPRALIVIDAAVLIQMGLLRFVDKLIVVKADRSQQIKRAKSKWRLSGPQIQKRIGLQLPLRKLVKKADFIIDNSGSLVDTEKQVREALRKVLFCR
jgi:dephospho-CoA kinase